MSRPETFIRPARCRRALACALTLAAISCLSARLEAESVDSEILLLVDVSSPGLSDAGFDDLMDGYASAFSSSEVLDSIQAGAVGRIAVSMMIFGNAALQQFVVPWMSIGSATDASQFASLVSNVVRPATFGFSSPASAIAAGTPSFGTETGGPANGFESGVQVMEVTAGGVPFPFAAGSTAAASTAAQTAGVDLINSRSVGPIGSIFENYYEENVIGSQIPGVVATSTSSPVDANLTASLTAGLLSTVSVGTAPSSVTIPEPSAVLLTLPALGFALFRRRRAV